MADAAGPAAELLPPLFRDWFAGRGWTARSHQLEMVAKGRSGRDALLIAPTGGGKTLAGFLPSLIDLSERPPANTPRGLHTIYISPLKALAVDVEHKTAILRAGGIAQVLTVAWLFEGPGARSGAVCCVVRVSVGRCLLHGA